MAENSHVKDALAPLALRLPVNNTVNTKASRASDY